EVRGLEEQLGRLNRDILQEQEAIRVLRAEWAYLNHPARLRDLAAQYSPLAPTKQSQIIASLEAIPMPLPGAPEMPGYPVPGRKPDGAAPVPTPGPALVAERTPAIEEKPTPAPPRPVRTAASPAPSGTPVDVLLASFRQQRTGQETSR
ncbi:MAG TPA: hypothetical protein VFO41_16045, partial [Alphaproteobacteria bacterium]|nr:hypothetical protein [Alphaproteobacteria bacterium]